MRQVRNDCDQEVHNGDIGYADDVDSNAGELSATLDGRLASFSSGELDALVPAYAATVHKSQASEYPAFVILSPDAVWSFVGEQHLYTGITHGDWQVVPVVQKKAVATATGNVSGRCQWSELDESLGNEKDV